MPSISLQFVWFRPVPVLLICNHPLKGRPELGNVMCNVYVYVLFSGIASSISEGDIFIYSCSAQLISFEIKSILKEINCAEHEYINMSPLLIELATPLVLFRF